MSDDKPEHRRVQKVPKGGEIQVLDARLGKNLSSMLLPRQDKNSPLEGRKHNNKYPSGRLRRHSERSAIIIIYVKTESNINKVSKDVTPLEPVVHTDKEEAQRR